MLADVVRKALPVTKDEEITLREIRVQFVVATFMTVLTWCLERKKSIQSAAQADAIFRALALGGVGPPGKRVKT